MRSPKGNGQLGKTTTDEQNSHRQLSEGIRTQANRPISQEPWARQDDISFPMVTASELLSTRGWKHYTYVQQSSTINMDPRVVYNGGLIFRWKSRPISHCPKLATDNRKAGKLFEPCVGIDKVSKILVLAPSFGRVQIQRIEDRLGYFRLVCRMERDTTLCHEGSRSSKFGENEDTVTLLLACHILEGHEIHSVAGRGEKANIGYRVQRGQFVEWHRAMHIQQRSALGCGWLVSTIPTFVARSYHVSRWSSRR